ncbi:MAG: UDP-2,4-diacetamido-2,4,6-trideoxy-beta-L-altropyranose hydrolase [Lachnospiraceae bacterium]|nr:UDP-2,4-diacetamido-2,4,6-trideoxy-beta-L-altropyranose hydrolase [Lachnospiraceae bacterium]
MIYIRADANKEIATGHIMRCLAIAEAFIEEDKDVCFIVADQYGEELVKKLGFPCLVLNSDFKEMEEELDVLKSVLEPDKTEVVLVDSYFVTENYLASIRNIAKTAYIDDATGKYLPCDIIVNYDLDAGRDLYSDYSDDIRFLLGGEYTPLRKQFRNQKDKDIRDKASEILILTGGSDHFHVVFNICEMFISKIDEFNDCVVNVVCGRYNEDYGRIAGLAGQYQSLKIFRSIDDIDLFMKRADACISAGGTTTKELAACGTPTITFSIADNQMEGVKSLDKRGLMRYIGDVRNEDFSYSRLIDELIILCRDKERRVRESKLLQKTIDGMGAVRIARELLK